MNGMTAKFWTHADKDGPVSTDPFSTVDTNCWLWTGGTGGDERQPYGRYLNQAPHRLAYEEMVGAIPVGHDLDHRCRVRLCVRPDHLEPVTRLENLLRSPLTIIHKNSTKDRCDNGHEFTEGNIYRRPDRKARECRTCRNGAVRRYKERIRVGR